MTSNSVAVTSTSAIAALIPEAPPQDNADTREIASFRVDARCAGAVRGNLWLGLHSGCISVHDSSTGAEMARIDLGSTKVRRCFHNNDQRDKDIDRIFASCITYSVGTETVWVGCTDGHIRVFDAASLSIASVFAPDAESMEHLGNVGCLAAYENLMVSGTADGIVYQWDATSRLLSAQSVAHTREVVAVVMPPASRKVVSIDSSGAISITAIPSGALLHAYRGVSPASCAALCGRQATLWVGGTDGTLRIFALPLNDDAGDMSSPMTFASAADGGRGASGLQRFASPRRREALPITSEVKGAHKGSILSLADLNGRMWTVGADRCAALWAVSAPEASGGAGGDVSVDDLVVVQRNAPAPVLIGVAPVHKSFICSVVAIARKEVYRIATASGDRSVKLWEDDGVYEPVGPPGCGVFDTLLWRRVANLEAANGELLASLQKQRREKEALAAALKAAETELARRAAVPSRSMTITDGVPGHGPGHCVPADQMNDILAERDAALQRAHAAEARANALAKRCAEYEVALRSSSDEDDDDERRAIRRAMRDARNIKNPASVARAADIALRDREIRALEKDKAALQDELARLGTNGAEMQLAPHHRARVAAARSQEEASAARAEADMLRNKLKDMERALAAAKREAGAIPGLKRTIDDLRGQLAHTQLQNNKAEDDLNAFHFVLASRGELVAAIWQAFQAVKAARRLATRIMSSPRMDAVSVAMAEARGELITRKLDVTSSYLRASSPSVGNGRRFGSLSTTSQRRLSNSSIAPLRALTVASSRAGGGVSSALHSTGGHHNEPVSAGDLPPMWSAFSENTNCAYNTLRYIVCNYLTEIEKMHVGAAISKFLPDHNPKPAVGPELLKKLSALSMQKRVAPNLDETLKSQREVEANGSEADITEAVKALTSNDKNVRSAATAGLAKRLRNALLEAASAPRQGNGQSHSKTRSVRITADSPPTSSARRNTSKPPLSRDVRDGTPISKRPSSALSSSAKSLNGSLRASSMPPPARTPSRRSVVLPF